MPPVPIPKDRAMKLAKQFAFIGYQITRLNPSIISDLAQAEMNYTPEEYSTLSLMSALWQGLLVFAAIYAIIIFTKNWSFLYAGLAMSAVFAGFMFLRSMAYPSYILHRRAHEIEKNFLYALRHLLIQVRGGTPIFNSMVSVAEAGYGELSNEFLRVVREINSGESMTVALERMALRNPSPYLRRMVWQMVNALRTGNNMGLTLHVILEQFTAEQRVLFQKFAKELAPWAMMYMLVTAIFPTLGITLFLIISSLSNIRLNEATLFSFIGMSIIVQYFFIQFLKTKRPVMRW